MPEPALLPTQPQSASASGSPKTRPKVKAAYSQAVELQAMLLNDARKKNLKPLYRAGLSRAWVELEECKRKLKMRPLPKPIDTEKHKARTRTKAGPSFSETPTQ